MNNKTVELSKRLIQKTGSTSLLLLSIKDYSAKSESFILPLNGEIQQIISISQDLLFLYVRDKLGIYYFVIYDIVQRKFICLTKAFSIDSVRRLVLIENDIFYLLFASEDKIEIYSYNIIAKEPSIIKIPFKNEYELEEIYMEGRGERNKIIVIGYTKDKKHIVKYKIDIEKETIELRKKIKFDENLFLSKFIYKLNKIIIISYYNVYLIDNDDTIKNIKLEHRSSYDFIIDQYLYLFSIIPEGVERKKINIITGESSEILISTKNQYYMILSPYKIVLFYNKYAQLISIEDNKILSNIHVVKYNGKLSNQVISSSEFMYDGTYYYIMGNKIRKGEEYNIKNMDMIVMKPNIQEALDIFKHIDLSFVSQNIKNIITKFI